MISPKWDAEDTNLFHYFSTTADNSTTFNSVTFARETDASSGKTEDDLALVAAIDGQTIKMTPMREAVIPPPMSAYEIHLDVPVTAVMFQNTNSQTESSFKLENNSSNNLGVVAGNKVYFFAVTEADKGTKSVGDEAVKITGAGGNGYIVQTSRHALVYSIQGKTYLKQKFEHILKDFG